MNQSLRSTLIPLFLLLFSACQSVTADPVKEAGDTDKTAAAGSEAVAIGTYIVQPGDVLQIDVWKEKDLLREVAVRPDGGINFPLVGDITAAGKTVEQLRNDLTEKLTKYVPDPVVTVPSRKGEAIRYMSSAR